MYLSTCFLFILARQSQISAILSLCSSVTFIKTSQRCVEVCRCRGDLSLGDFYDTYKECFERASLYMSVLFELLRWTMHVGQWSVWSDSYQASLRQLVTNTRCLQSLQRHCSPSENNVNNVRKSFVVFLERLYETCLCERHPQTCMLSLSELP